jgi:hypothetical protein
MPTIAELFTVGFPAVLQNMKGGRRWVDRDLEALQQRGRILLLHHLGIHVELYNDRGPNRIYPIVEVRVPIVWTKRDDNQTDNEIISLTARLIENGIHSHDDILLERIRNHRAYVAEQYRYMISQPVEVEGTNGGIMCMLSTAAAFVPDETSLDIPEEFEDY